jgi:hypothetical protein
MNKFGYEYQSDFARKYVAQGVAEGKAEGKAEGEAEEARRLVLRLARPRRLTRLAWEVTAPAARAGQCALLQVENRPLSG